jgi:hypothetical protein
MEIAMLRVPGRVENDDVSTFGEWVSSNSDLYVNTWAKQFWHIASSNDFMANQTLKQVWNSLF